MRRRSGFTLVELLVAMALILFMMVILSEAFSVGLDSFRRLKAIGDMNGRLRTAVIALQADLQADHFEAKKRLSDPIFWAGGPPANGFFRIWQGSLPSRTDPAAPYYREADDAGGDLIPSSRATDHILHFTVKRRGNDRRQFFLANVPTGSPLSPAGADRLTDARYQDTPGTYTSQWAEVAWFLRPTGESTGQVPLFALYRRQRVVVPDDHFVNRGGGQVSAGLLNQYVELSCQAQGGNLYFNGPMDLTIPQRRLGMDRVANGGIIPAALGGQYPRVEDDGRPDLANADLLLTDVISFEVTVLLENGQDFVNLYDASVTGFQSGNPRFTAANGPRVFDTWSNYKDDVYDYSGWDQRNQETSIPLYRAGETSTSQIRITALKITLRVWDVKTGQARQVSLVQDM